MAADGISNQDIAKTLGISRPTVQLWRERFLALRAAGLEMVDQQGLHYNPLSREFKLAPGVEVNYLVAARKPF